MAFKCLLKLKPSLMSIVYADEAQATSDKLIVIGDTKAKTKAHTTINIIKNPLFWHAITQFIFH
jgi:hypothetical protein